MSASATPTFTGFGPDLVQFYRELATNNTKEHWHEQLALYQEQIAEPAAALASALAEEFGNVKVFRPYRDVRFSADKSPYQSMVSMAHQNPDGTVLYFSASADVVDLAAGIHVPTSDQLQRFREVQDEPDRVRSMDDLLGRLEAEGFALSRDDMVKTAPRGWSTEHPRIDSIRRRRLTVEVSHEPGGWLNSPECLDEVAHAWRQMQHWCDWLAENVGPPTTPRASHR